MTTAWVFADEVSSRIGALPSSPQPIAVPFPKIFIINLDHRTDRWDVIKKLCDETGLPAERIPAVVDSRGWVGCGYSHKNIVELAKQKEWPWVLILEDDAHFDNTSISRFKKLLPYLWHNRDKWDRFSGGVTFFYNPDNLFIDIKDIHRQIFLVQATTSHFDLINSSAYDRVLGWTPDAGVPIDCFYCDLATKGFRNICTFPHIATQSISNSDIIGREADYIKYFRDSNLELKRRLLEAAPRVEGLFEMAARHPDWMGNLMISKNGTFIWHKNTPSMGTYEIKNDFLIAHWYDFPPESFRCVSGYLLSSKFPQ